MNRRILRISLLLSLSLLAPAACVAPSGQDAAESSASADTAIHWQAAIRCDGAVLDVNADERRDLQFVIRDANAVDGLTHGSVDLGNVPGAVNAKGEFILTGHVQHGIFHASDFSSVQVVNGSSITGSVVVAGESSGAPGAGGGGDPSDLMIWFGEYTQWRFRNCRGEL